MNPAEEVPMFWDGDSYKTGSNAILLSLPKTVRWGFVMNMVHIGVGDHFYLKGSKHLTSVYLPHQG